MVAEHDSRSLYIFDCYLEGFGEETLALLGALDSKIQQAAVQKMPEQPQSPRNKMANTLDLLDEGAFTSF